MLPIFIPENRLISFHSQAWKWGLVLLVAIVLWSCSKPDGSVPAGPPVKAIEAIQIARAAMGGDTLTADMEFLTVSADWVQGALSHAVKAEMGIARPVTRDCDDWARAGAHIAARIFAKAGHPASPAVGELIRYDPSGNGSGIGKHAQCWFIDENRVVYLWEPQTGQIWLPTPQDRQDAIWRRL